MSVAPAAPPIRLSGGPAFARFCADYIRQSKGRRFARQPLILESWQDEFWDEALEIDPATGLRVYQEVIFGIPKKNGKSTQASAGGLYLLGMDGEEQPEVYAAAAAKGQAAIVMGGGISMVRQSPALLDVFRPFKYHIECPDNGGVFRVVSAVAALQQGINPSGNIIDELEAHKSLDLYTALTNASGARDQPLTITITTAGDDEEGPLGQIVNRMLLLPNIERRGMLTIARDRANGVLMFWYGAPAGANIDDPELWRACNPASWLQDLRWLTRQRNKPTTRDRDFMQWHLNMWVPLEDQWLQDIAGGWEARKGPVAFDRSLPVGIGVDKGETHDDTALVVAQRQGDRVIVKSKIWSNPYPIGNRARGSWRMPTVEIVDQIRQLKVMFPAAMAANDDGWPIPGPAVAFDPWHFSESAEVLEHDRINMVTFRQTAARLGPASMLAYALIKDRLLVHDGDPVLARHVQNTTARKVGEGARMVTKPKKKTERKNDACIAMVMAIAMAAPEAPAPAVRKSRPAMGF